MFIFTRELAYGYGSSGDYNHHFYFFNMEIAENEKNNMTNPVNNPPPPSSAHYSRVVYIVYTICICVHISAGTGLKKRFIYNPLNEFKQSKKLDTFFVSYFLRYKKIDTFFHVLNVLKVSEIAGSAYVKLSLIITYYYIKRFFKNCIIS